jgi:cytoskeleton-associated protein 5
MYVKLFSIVADIRVAVKNKVPLVRSLTLNWVTFCIETSNKPTVLKLHKEYVPICMEVGNHFLVYCQRHLFALTYMYLC